MKYKNRLFELRGDKKQAQIARELGMTQQNYANYESGKQGMKSDMIERVCKLYGCTAEWLLGFDDNNNRTSSPIIDVEIEVPLLGRIAAGEAIEMDAVENTFPIPKAIYDKYPESFLLIVDGESMNRILPSGCYALINPTNEVTKDNAPYAICINGYDATIKRVHRLNNGFELVPDSTDPTFEPKVFNYNEPNTMTITPIGEVVWYTIPYDWSF